MIDPGPTQRERLRVAHVINSFGVGGAETMLLRLVTGADRARYHHSVVALVEDGAIGEQLRSAGIETAVLGMSRGRFSPTRLASLARVLHGLRPHVVQTWMYHSDLLGGIAARLATRAPVVWGIHNTTFDAHTTKRTTRWTRTACAVASRFVPKSIVSCSGRALTLHRDVGYATAGAVVIPNGIDTRRFRPDPDVRRATRGALGIPPDALVLGMAARFDPQKDFPTFLRMAAAVRRRHATALFVLCGSGVDLENADLARLVRAEGLADCVRLLGRVHDMAGIYNAWDVCVLSSRYGEAFPLTIGEAMACGVPCVATDVGECAWMIADTGHLAAPSDADGLADGACRLLGMSAAARAALGVRARERVIAEFDLETVVRRYHELYEAVSDWT